MTTAADARRWIDGFTAAERAAAAARRQTPVDRGRSIALALSLIDAARQAFGGRFPHDPRRAADDAAVREVWARLRARQRR